MLLAVKVVMGVTFSRRLLGLASGVIWLGAADAAGNAEVFDLGSKLKAFDYSVVRAKEHTGHSCV